MCQSVPIAPRQVIRTAIWLPFICQIADGAVVVAPQDVALAVAVEVAGAGDVPVESRPCRRWLLTAIWLPFICQIASVPLSLRHRMSLLPSPLKSPVADHVPVAADRAERGACRRCGCRSSARSPTVPSSLRHRMSVLPSPLKSAERLDASTRCPRRTSPKRRHRLASPAHSGRRQPDRSPPCRRRAARQGPPCRRRRRRLKTPPSSQTNYCRLQSGSRCSNRKPVRLAASHCCRRSQGRALRAR